MSELSVRVQNLGKRFQIGSASRYNRLSEVITALGRASWGGAGKTDFWALREVSFDVHAGDVVGIIGRNGAGKSTLLKILSRITEPTTGRFGVQGRVGSLLEVGTGFHPELTGRENVFLSGAILGMTRREVKLQFDEIVAFAEVDDFLDTPVKRYSSGMKVRLGFAVAAHLRPEILIVDEVLAVGDAAFQKKCLGKMNDVAAGGRTILFVSHNMAAIESLCSSCLYIDAGQLAEQGPVAAVVASYLNSFESEMSEPLAHRTDRSGDGHVRFTGLRIEGNASDAQIVSGGKLNLILDLAGDCDSLEQIQLAIVVSDQSGNRLTTFDSTFCGADLKLSAPGSTVQCEVPQLLLVPGRYSLYLWLAVNGRECDRVERAAIMDVFEGDFFGTGRVPVAAKHGSMLLQHSFRIQGDTPQ